MELENFCFNNFGSATPFLNGFQIVNSYSLKQAFQARDQNEKEKYWGLWDFFWGGGVGGLDLLATYSTVHTRMYEFRYIYHWQVFLRSSAPLLGIKHTSLKNPAVFKNTDGKSSICN